jgi:hypothetical protein
MNPTDPRITKLPKWAQEIIANQQQEIVRLRGLPTTLEKIKPDLPPPTSGSGKRLTRGWTHNLHGILNRIGGTPVDKGCSSSVYHGYGWERTCSQQPKSLYSTERLAWQALKAEFTQWAAERAAWIDEQTEKASDERAPESDT